jgi:hypothetical protein
MQASRLDNTALRFELKIRNLHIEEKMDQNARKLRQALRDENADPSQRPCPKLDPLEEAPEIMSYITKLQEATTFTDFRKGEKCYEDVYAQLCHIEGRVAYVDWTVSDDAIKFQDAINKMSSDLRAQHFADKAPYVKVTQRKVDEEGLISFSENEEKQLEAMEQKVIELKKKKELATIRERSQLHEIEETQSEDEREEANELEELRREVKRLQLERAQNNGMQRDQSNGSLGRGSSSGVANGPPPPQNPHPQNAPRIPNPFDPINPNPSSSAQYNAANNSFLNDPQFNSTSVHSRRTNSLPVHKWQIYFDGKSDGEVIAFIKDVENMAIAQRTSVDDVRQGISTLLKGSARDWYRVCGYQLGTWTMFVSGLKEFFLPADFDHRVDADIRATMQNETETFQEFCIRMELVFMKLSYEMPEFMKVEHLKHNMHRSYKTADVARLKTINELREACRYVDSINERFRAAKARPEKPNFYRPQPKIFAVQGQLTENFPVNQSDDDEMPSSASQIAAADECQREIQEVQAQSRELRFDAD